MQEIDLNFISHFKKIKGAFSVSEAVALYGLTKKSPMGLFIELGTHLGKSASVLAYGLPEGVLYLIEPEFKDNSWMNEASRNVNKYKNNLITVAEEATTSLEFIPTIKYNFLGGCSFCLIDSSIHDDMVMEEVKALEDLMAEKGIIVFHDYKNQFTAVERAYDYLVGTGKYEPIKINWQEIFDYVAKYDLENGNNSWHLYPELGHPPNFVGAVRRK